jgi:hypothetical protein
MELGAVFVSEGKVREHFPEGGDAKFGLERRCFLGAYALEELYFGIEKSHDATSA